MNRFIHRFVSHPSKGIVSRQQLFSELQKKSLLWFGEFHSEGRIVALQKELLVHLLCNTDSKLHVVMEHFSFEMQDMLQKFQSDPNFGFEDLKRTYREIGTEGHGLDPYEGFLLHCKNPNDINGANVELHGGFIPRPLASRWYKAADANEKREVLEECYEKGYLPPPGDPRHAALFAIEDKLLLDGSPSHFRLVRSMMSGEDLYSPLGEPSDDETANYLGDAISTTPIGKLYQAQLLKDHAMGYHLSKLLKEPQNKNDRFLVIAGMGHLKHGTGVPERLDKYIRTTTSNSSSTSDDDFSKHALRVCDELSASVGCQMLYETYLEDRYRPLKELEETEEKTIEDETETSDDDESDDAKTRVLNDLYVNNPDLFDKLVLESEVIQGPMFHFADGIGGFSKPSVDYCYVYDEDDDNVLLPSSTCPSATAKAETREAYNSVGATAGSQGSIKKARTIMTHLQYTQEDMDLIGEDSLYNFQGVANPHRVANLQPGERVLDIGSGLGVDSLLAAKRVMSSGSVLGVDLAVRQVAHSKAVAISKGLHHLDFIQGDAEKLSHAVKKHGIEEGSFDVCISNGAFCLIPDKKKAFDEVYKALKPGGRMAISTTTMQTPLLEQEGPSSETKFEWPICMRMFADIKDIKPICEQIGFCDVEVIDAESPMEMEFEQDVFEDENPERFKIHGKYADQYAYLEEMDMDKLCKIVTIYGRKPVVS